MATTDPVIGALTKILNGEIDYKSPLAESIFFKMAGNINAICEIAKVKCDVLTPADTEWLSPTNESCWALIFGVGGGGGGGGGGGAGPGAQSGVAGGDGLDTYFDGFLLGEGGDGGGGGVPAYGQANFATTGTPRFGIKQNFRIKGVDCGSGGDGDTGYNFNNQYWSDYGNGGTEATFGMHFFNPSANTPYAVQVGAGGVKGATGAGSGAPTLGSSGNDGCIIVIHSGY